MDHLAIIDWDGFKALTDPLGGVLIYIPETVTEGADVTWSKGYQYMYGEEALRYVRTRHGLAGGDFDRIRRRKNFIRSLMGDVLEKGTLGNPLKLASVLDAVTRNLTVDDEWSSGDLRGLAFSMRGLRTNNVTFLARPWRPTGTSRSAARAMSCCSTRSSAQNSGRRSRTTRWARTPRRTGPSSCPTRTRSTDLRRATGRCGAVTPGEVSHHRDGPLLSVADWLL